MGQIPTLPGLQFPCVELYLVPSPQVFCVCLDLAGFLLNQSWISHTRLCQAVFSGTGNWQSKGEPPGPGGEL